MAKEPIKAEIVTPEVTSPVINSAPVAADNDGLSAQTRAEMEAGRQALKAYQDTIKSRTAD